MALYYHNELSRYSTTMTWLEWKGKSYHRFFSIPPTLLSYVHWIGDMCIQAENPSVQRRSLQVEIYSGYFDFFILPVHKSLHDTFCGACIRDSHPMLASDWRLSRAPVVYRRRGVIFAVHSSCQSWRKDLKYAGTEWGFNIYWMYEFACMKLTCL